MHKQANSLIHALLKLLKQNTLLINALLKLIKQSTLFMNRLLTYVTLFKDKGKTIYLKQCMYKQTIINRLLIHLYVKQSI